jgi:hypothetical protein
MELVELVLELGLGGLWFGLGDVSARYLVCLIGVVLGGGLRFGLGGVGT